MGNRATVEVVQDPENVFLYSHWGGESVLDAVCSALARRQRWDDPPYLARIIFCEMVRGQEREETGFGIQTYQPPDTFYNVRVNCEGETVTIEDYETPTVRMSFKQAAARADAEASE